MIFKPKKRFCYLFLILLNSFFFKIKSTDIKKKKNFFEKIFFL